MRPLLLLLAATSLLAQDTLDVTSPNGQIAFRVGVFLPPEHGSFLRLGYQVSFKGKPLLDTSYMGFLIHNQEPLLGQNLGLTTSKSGHTETYNWLVGEFLQNGSLGRRINVEVRAFDDAVGFRYIIPWSNPLQDIVIEQEETEFRFPKDLPTRNDPPLRVELPGTGWITIVESPLAGYPKLLLDPVDSKTMKSVLSAPKDRFPVEATTPLTTSWRVLVIGSTPVELNSFLLDRFK